MTWINVSAYPVNHFTSAPLGDSPSDTLNQSGPLTHSPTAGAVVQPVYVFYGTFGGVGDSASSNLQLPEGWKKASSVRFDLRALLAETKLHREPVNLQTWNDCKSLMSKTKIKRIKKEPIWALQYKVCLWECV